MLPLREEAPPRAAPLAVAALLGAQALVFAVVASTAPHPEEAVGLLERWGLVPRVFLRALAGPPDALWLTPLTAMFLHEGPLHLAGNALFLWVLGRRVEARLGSRRFMALYLGCGLAAAAVHVAAAPDSYVPAIGSSGAVSGLLGAYAVSDPGGRLSLAWSRVRVPAIACLLAWIALQGASGLSSLGESGGGIAWWAHLGGFAAGAALARPLWTRRPSGTRLRA